MGEWGIVVTSFLFIVQGNHLVVELSTTGSNGEALFPCFNIRFQEASNPFDLLIVTNYELLGNETLTMQRICVKEDILQLFYS
jgi:hypothetical protein